MGEWTINQVIGGIIIIIGLAFDFFGSLGLVRLPNLFNRLQAATKCVTLGTCGIMFGVFIYKGGFTAGGVKALLIIAFLLLTSPVAAHAIARGAHRSGVRLYKDAVCDKYAEDKEGESEGE